MRMITPLIHLCLGSRFLPFPCATRKTLPSRLRRRAYGFTLLLSAAPASSLGWGFLLLATAALWWMATLLLEVCLRDSDLPRVHPSRRSRRSSGRDFRCHLVTTRLVFRYLVSIYLRVQWQRLRLQCWSLGAPVLSSRLSSTRLSRSGRGTVIAARQRLILVAIVVVR